jgi:hypothetical protein
MALIAHAYVATPSSISQSTSLTANRLYHYFVASFGNPLALGVPIWSLTAEQSVSIVVEFIVRRYVTFLSSGGDFSH